MKIKFIGTGTCIDTKRTQSCILIESNETKVLVDIGVGSFTRLENYNDIDAVLITHHHLDHNGDLLALLKARWLSNADELRIYGPSGTRVVIESLLEAYPYLRRKLRFKVIEDPEFRIGDLEIKTMPTIHSITSRAYIIKKDEKIVVVSGDTKPFKDLMSVRCDILIHEMSLPFGYKSEDHTTPESFATLLKYCNADIIYLTHMYPNAREVKDDIVNYLKKFKRDIEIEVAEDSLTLRIT